jgi:hypothetical protein
MKKTFTLIAMIIALSSLTSYSQVLPNTTWAVYDQSTLAFYIRFDATILYFSSDNVNYTSGSYYEENESDFTVSDITNGACSVADTGRYTFLIQNDTLMWTFVSDPCVNRQLAFMNYDWVMLPTGIADAGLPAFRAYPNPATDKIFIYGAQSSAYSISDQTGRQVQTGSIAGETSSINIRGLATGVYYLRLSETGRGFRFIKN